MRLWRGVSQSGEHHELEGSAAELAAAGTPRGGVCGQRRSCGSARRDCRDVLTEASWQRCYMHFLRKALDYLPRKGDEDCNGVRWLYDRRNLEEAGRVPGGMTQ
jgi:hypothetical protein